MLLNLLLSATLSHAGSFTLNAKNCGDLSSLSIDGRGNTSAQTTRDCGVSPTPIPPPIPDTGKPCPDGTLCFDKPWPVIAQATYGMTASQIMSFKIKTTGAPTTGRIFSMYTTGDTATRLIVISDSPGSMTPITQSCETKGLEVANLIWNIASAADRRKCIIPADSTLYVNVKFTNCESGKVCRFYFGAN